MKVNQANNHIYFDYAATTPVDPRVLAAMSPYFEEAFGNTSSIHAFGQQAEAALEGARSTMAQGLNCRPDEIIFTSCGSESDNLALRGAAFAARRQRSANHILISPVEHHAISITAEHLAKYHGFELEYLPADQYGMVQTEDVAARLRPDTAIVSIIYANNEVGTINPIQEIGAICREKGVPFHSDAVQAAAYLPVDVEAMNIDLVSLGAHKFYGPKGVGALYVRKDTPILPVLTGGGQEFGLRAGTHNTPYIVGMAKAFELAQIERETRIANLRPLRDSLISKIISRIPAARLTGHPEKRMPNHSSFIFQGVDGNTLLMLLDLAGYACSSGSACKTGDPEPSEVLTKLGYAREWAFGSLRVTLGESSTKNQVASFINTLPALIEKCRTLAS